MRMRTVFGFHKNIIIVCTQYIECLKKIVLQFWIFEVSATSSNSLYMKKENQKIYQFQKIPLRNMITLYTSVQDVQYVNIL